MATNRNDLPTAHLTQRDFVSTFPWGLTGDRVRILMQQAGVDWCQAANRIPAFGYAAKAEGMAAEMIPWKG